jgi:hypothetical protein
MTTQAEALAGFASVIARARMNREQRYEAGGAQAVAQAAWVPGGPSKEEIAARYQRWQDEAAAAGAKTA